MTLLSRPTALLCFAVFLASGHTAACQVDTPDRDNEEDTRYAFPYNLSHPAALFELPREMREISGLTTLPGDRLAAVQDEDGDLFILSADDGVIVRTVRFGKDGDYEGVEQVGDTTYVLRSDGRLYEVPANGTDRDQVRVYETGVSTRCNAEGLGYHGASSALLIACKDYAGKKKKGKKVVHAFDLNRKELRTTPALIVDGLDPTLQPSEGVVSRNIRKLLRKSGFRPSGIATHPVSGDTYIVSSAGSLVGVFDASGVLRTAVRLNRKTFPQPEGIAFGKDGTMFISTEAGSGPARIGVFPYDITSLIDADSTSTSRP